MSMAHFHYQAPYRTSAKNMAIDLPRSMKASYGVCVDYMANKQS